ncbi:MAG: tRNA (adenosine(37)-N6)-threonylcarbamoyltransferase complex transferase subunit TsaD [Candidatus Andersenbacteria bacterium]|nr:tRNA (adenosine(37)-N6)-threonylcarbamoyltransferase complex transferase subunit TsaD [Candidatus Andersenbacteria bacterium]MBI3250630.1 tRNA (adenosine(37)-N6)-threonylcarbamoyltransferase complex transferase subunit TsaD [Candidatus Andersenbacteria bacterium]
MSTVLAIETSCDETGVAVMEKKGEKITVYASAVASQIDIHAETGGVVPDVAAREHVKVITPLIKKILQQSGKNKETIDAIAVTVGPGLMPALSVGVQAARTLAFAWNKPLVPVHHLEGHIVSALLGEEGIKSTYTIPASPFPALALIVSGGHTMLVRTDDFLHYQLLGQTKDDAAGEVFDKVARMLKLPYPGGPHVSKIAERGDVNAFKFPRPMIHSGDLHFSFSGLKTAVLYALRDNPSAKKEDIAASFQMAVVDSLLKKTEQALEIEEYKTLLLSGGVAANALLRAEIGTLAVNQGIKLCIAPLSLCGDNAVMIGQVGLLAFEAGRKESWQNVDAKARMSLESFSARSD